MRRFPDWPTRLWRAVQDRKDRPHAWGSNDCALYVADLIAAMTGEDLGKFFRGHYSDQAGATEILQAHGFKTLADLADACLPRCTKPHRGDVVLLPGAAGEYLAVSMGRDAIAADVRRPRLRPMTGMIAAWRV